jgi:beta-phosphoglucomutase
MRIAAVVFDMDGVLCDSEAMMCEAAQRLFRDRYGVTVAAADFRPFVGAGEDRYLGGVAEQYGIAWDLERDKRYAYDVYLRLITGRLQPLPGVHAFLARCRAAGIRTAVATSADARKMHGNLVALKFAPGTFDVCVNGLEVAHKKPDPEIFATAIARLGLRPDEALVVEDAINGVQAAKAAGAYCLALTTSFTARELRAAGADFVAPDLASIPDVILCALRTSTPR